jgi:hypothetical protein
MKIVEVVTPIIAYHGTVDSITQFRPLTHFGTEKAARDRMDYKKNANGKIYKVQLNIHNPFTVKDFAGNHYDRVYAFDLRDKKKISQEEMEKITMLQDPAQLRAALLAKVKELGYDGFVYKNRYEDKGNISYVILDPSQVKVLEVIPVGATVSEDRVDELNVSQTLQFIKQAHGDQLYGELPYWTHPRAVALTGRKIFGSRFTSDAVKTAFLHDVVEDTYVGLDELSKLDFDPKVIEAVALLTKDKSMTYKENIEKIINSGNKLAMMVKYADNYENYTGDKSGWEQDKVDSSQRKYLRSLNMLGNSLGVQHHIEENIEPDYEEQIEDFVQSLNPDDVGVEQIGPYHVHFEGFTDDCQDDANRRCNLPSNHPRHLASYDDVYKEVIKDFVRREGGKKPLKVGFTGDQDYPIIYAVFDNPEPYKNPDAWNPTFENFADGKKPGRKGLAKRSGVDCSKSETALRKIAKNSSGEKQRMAHWCANMKGGKK